MNISAFVEKNDEIKKYDCRYYLHPNLWLENAHSTSKLHSQDSWSGYIKYLMIGTRSQMKLKICPKIMEEYMYSLYRELVYLSVNDI